MLDKTTLRSGFTTGACAAAAARAAYSGRVTPVLFPDGSRKFIPVEIQGGSAVVIKDAGDDPDVTNQAAISVEVLESGRIEPEDYSETAANGLIIICGGSGVGLATRPGLDVPPGKWAINPGPRRMIVANLIDAGFSGGSLRVTVSVANGEKIAAKTLNPELGIVGGISILGTSGIVVPYSNDAYIHTIRLRVRTVIAEGAETLAFTTGHRTETALLRDYPELTGTQIVRIADFIGAALESTCNTTVNKLIVACMPGKLYKYACGHKNTHAHKVKLEAATALELLREQPPEVLEGIEKCNTVGEMRHYLTTNDFHKFIDMLAQRALEQLTCLTPGTDLTLAVYDSDGETLAIHTGRREP